MDITPRNQFNNKLANRFLDIPTDIPKAVHFNTPQGTHYCDQLGFLCHPQDYQTFQSQNNYRDIQVESQLYNLDYYNPFDYSSQGVQELHPELIQSHFNGDVDRCSVTPKIWYNHSKLHKFNTPF